MRNLVATVICAIALQGCAPGKALGIRFPIGTADRGREEFLTLQCNACHTVEDVQLPPYAGPRAMSVLLGGHTRRIESYGDLVTSIVNPSHRLARGYKALGSADGESPMAAAYLNDVMTIQQLVDIVAFLQAEYEYVPPPVPPYWESYPSGGGEPRPGFPRD